MFWKGVNSEIKYKWDNTVNWQWKLLYCGVPPHEYKLKLKKVLNSLFIWMNKNMAFFFVCVCVRSEIH